MFNDFINLFSHNPIKAVYILLSLLWLLIVSINVSLDDIRKRKVVFWKMLIVGFSVILTTSFYSLFSGMGYQFIVFMFFSIPLYVIGLALNIMFNNDRIMGKADVDIILSYLSVASMFSAWSFFDKTHSIFAMDAPYVWSMVFGSMAVGLIVGVIVFVVHFAFLVVKKKRIWIQLVKEPVPALPMFIVPTLVVPMSIMLF